MREGSRKLLFLNSVTGVCPHRNLTLWYNVYMMSDVKKAHRGIPAVNQGSLVRDECWDKILPSNIPYRVLDEQKVLKSASLYYLWCATMLAEHRKHSCC